jgi:hypothetical protein
LADRRRSSWQRGILKVRPPDEPAFQAALKKFPAPDRAVDALAGPVECDPYDALSVGTLVVREAARDVRVVVLDADRREPVFF